MSFLILHGGVEAYSVQYIECVHVVSHSLIVSFAFALVQLVGQIDAEKHCAKGLWLEKLSHTQNLDIPDPAEKGCF